MEAHYKPVEVGPGEVEWIQIRDENDDIEISRTNKSLQQAENQLEVKMDAPKNKWEKMLEEEGFKDNEEVRRTSLSIDGPLPSQSLGQDT